MKRDLEGGRGFEGDIGLPTLTDLNSGGIAYSPSPEAGAWNQAYFEALLKNANPKLA